MTRIVRLKTRTAPYVVLDKSIDDDAGISYRAKGIHRRWMGMPSDWRFNLSEFAAHASEGRDAIASAVMELRRFGYAELYEARDQRGKVVAHEWICYEVSDPAKLPRHTELKGGRGLFLRWSLVPADGGPRRQRFQRKKPEPENPYPGEPVPVNPPVLSIQRNEVSNDQSAARPISLRSHRRRRRLGATLPTPLACLHRLLLQHGFESSDATDLILEWGPRRVLTTVRNFEFYAMSGARKGRGWLVKGFRIGYDLLEGLQLVLNEDERLALEWEAAHMTGRQIAEVPRGMSEHDSSAERARQLRELEEN